MKPLNEHINRIKTLMNIQEDVTNVESLTTYQGYIEYTNKTIYYDMVYNTELGFDGEYDWGKCSITFNDKNINDLIDIEFSEEEVEEITNNILKDINHYRRS